MNLIDQITALLSAHPKTAISLAWGAQFVFSAFVDSLPQPRIDGTQFYLFAFTFAHKIAGNLTRNTDPVPPKVKPGEKN